MPCFSYQAINQQLDEPEFVTESKLAKMVVDVRNATPAFAESPVSAKNITTHLKNGRGYVCRRGNSSISEPRFRPYLL